MTNVISQASAEAGSSSKALKRPTNWFIEIERYVAGAISIGLLLLAWEVLSRWILPWINPRAAIRAVHFGQTPVAELLDIRGFNLNAILEISPDFLDSDEHEHDEAVASFVFRSERAFDVQRLEEFLGGLVQVYGQDMLRYKGVLFVKGSDRRLVFQGVHQMMGADYGKRWQPGEKQASKMVFIGRNLPRETFLQGLEHCLVKVGGKA